MAGSELLESLLEVLMLMNVPRCQDVFLFFLLLIQESYLRDLVQRSKGLHVFCQGLRS